MAGTVVIYRGKDYPADTRRNTYAALTLHPFDGCFVLEIGEEEPEECGSDDSPMMGLGVPVSEQVVIRRPVGRYGNDTDDFHGISVTWQALDGSAHREDFYTGVATIIVDLDESPRFHVMVGPYEAESPFPDEEIATIFLSETPPRQMLH